MPRTNVREISADLWRDLERVREHVLLEAPEDVREALAGVETFCAIALRVFAKTNPSKLRSEAMTVEIAARLHGRPVSEGEGEA